MKNFIFSFLALLLLPTYMMGQAQAIKGKVVDSNGMGIPGAIIASADARATADADFDGNFTINAKPGDILKVSMLGFDSVSVPATAAPMTITLKEAGDTALKEVVVIGYGTRKKIDNTSAVSSIKSEEITKMKVINASQAIQGKAAGVQVATSDAPGSTPSIVIRGVGTALGGRNPLYVVDGMPTDNINNINSNDITSYEVLKDASALAIYGTRGANGVIMITTKTGKGKLTVDIDSYAGFRSPLKKVKMANADQYIQYNNAAFISQFPAGRFSQNQPYNTNWFDEITRTGVYTQNNVSLSGSGENIKYFFSVGNYEEEGILKGTEYGRTTFRSNNEYKISEKLKISQNFSVSSIKNTPQPMSAFTSAYRQSPLVPVRYPNGKYGVPFIQNGVISQTGDSFNSVGNPVVALDYNNEQQKTVTLQGGLRLDWDIMKSLKFTSQFNGEYFTYKQYNFVDNLGLWLAADPSRVESAYDKKSLNTNTLTRNTDDYFNWNLSNYFTYNKVFAEIHDVEVTAGIEANVIGTRSKTTADIRNVNPNSNYWGLDGINYAQNGGVTTYKAVNDNQARLASYFARFQYKLLDRYLLTGTVRRDGSSNYSSDYRWGTFPSVGIGWIVTKESFLSDIKNLDLLKVRGSWGKLGNQKVPLNIQSFTSGVDYNGGSGTTINSQIDPSLSWEIVEEASAGIDVELFNSRLKGSFDVYSKNTNNAILNVTPYSTSGITVESPTHVGEVSNKGYEIALRWDDKITDNLSYWVGGNFSHNKNELASLKNVRLATINGGSLGNGQVTKILDNTSVGQPLGSFYMYEYAGVDPANGQMLYYTADGNKVAQGALDQTKDRKYVGSVLPTSTYGVTLGLNYKNVDFSVDGYGTNGAKVYNGKKAQRFYGENVETSLLNDMWTPTNTSGSNPAPFNQVPVASTYYLESGDFFRINNITLGYKLPLREEGFISYCRIYVNAMNPFISQKFSGFSPEVLGDGELVKGTQGVELDAYPALKTFVVGANLKF
ncbi:SusC/RagA family TonB-linked outer membrane protein [Flavobacterium tyrosinilyticum]|uniref:SusC/RagA family TonB-linked outer membrane protein n=1 Tax=Flavobacterium tyrosinilyticum TaxID=1658740 RepID=UPI00202F1E7A|nr:SusC/RagA family TonB-linked outer membrane protein [Flavobacterium tyrosinilyticum]MCM0666628.1 SusC/RagA family TonB-linked outer membrane protein [Flavobacterium tyrosinilyticum]